MTKKTARGHLKAFIERIEKLEEEKKELGDDIRSVYGEAKDIGFNASTLRRIIKLRKLSPDERVEQEVELATYMAAIGMHTRVEIGDLDEALDHRRSEAGKSKTEGRAAATAAEAEQEDEEEEHRAPPGGGLTKAQIRAAADRAESRSRSCEASQEVIRGPMVADATSELLVTAETSSTERTDR